MNRSIDEAVILAGGRGERLRPFTDTLPKPLYPINDLPFIEYLIKQIKGFGIRKIIILLGYLAPKVIEYLGNGKKYDVEIIYDVTPESYDTLERLFHAKNKIQNNFLLMYCDNYCPIDFNALVNNFYSHNADIELSVYDNSDLYTKNNVLVNQNGMVEIYDKLRKASNLNGVEIGYSIVKRRVLDIPNISETNFARGIFPYLALRNKLYATFVFHRYYSIGSYERMQLTEQFFKPKKVVFLDRDGTINQKAPKACYIEKSQDFIWLDGAKEAIKLLNDNDVITILITNQPGIARGNLTIQDLNSIHQKMQMDLKEIGARIDYIYYCPHNWDEGCNCRKPKPGMLYQAQKDLSLDLTKCVMFGDDERDMEAANSAMVKGILITSKNPLIKAVKDYLERS